MSRSGSLVDQLTALLARVPRGMLLGLDRVEDALSALGDPQRGVTAVHVAGSNGKGSTCAMVESIARAAGLRTGLYTSPHLCRFAERIRLDGEPIDDVAFERALGAVLARCRPDLTFFESLTVAAFHAFREARVDVAILEVGLGGRLDATNVVEAPIATAVTSISLEHTAILGDTLATIAREKAGIFKPCAPVVLGSLEQEADRAIIEVARQVGTGPLERARSWTGQLGLEGPHQAANAGIAAGLAHHLALRFPGRDWNTAIGAGLARVRWPGRFERIERSGVTVILDAAHNPEGARALRRTIDAASWEPSRTALVFGALADKRWPEMLALLAPLATRRYYTEPKGRAPASLEELVAMAVGDAVAAPCEAMQRALAESRVGDTILVTGSIYLVGEVRAELLEIETDPAIAL